MRLRVSCSHVRRVVVFPPIRKGGPSGLPFLLRTRVCGHPRPPMGRRSWCGPLRRSTELLYVCRRARKTWPTWAHASRCSSMSISMCWGSSGIRKWRGDGSAGSTRPNCANSKRTAPTILRTGRVTSPLTRPAPVGRDRGLQTLRRSGAMPGP